MERTIQSEEPETLDADMFQEEEAAAKVRQRAPGRASRCSRTGSDSTGEPPDTRSSGRVVALGGSQDPHGLQPGSLRRGLRRPRQGIEIRRKAADDPGSTSSKNRPH